MTDTTWLTDAGLVPVSEGTWRDEETGFDVVHYFADEFRICLSNGQGVLLKRGLISGTALQASPDWALQVADALHLAARLARAYNERGR